MHQADYFFLCVAGRWWERREIVELRGRRLHDTFHRAAAESESNQPLFAYWGAEQPTIIFMREPEKSWIGSAPPLWCKIRHGRCCRSLIETLHFPRHQFSLAGRQLPPRFFFSSLCVRIKKMYKLMNAVLDVTYYMWNAAPQSFEAAELWRGVSLLKLYLFLGERKKIMLL